MSCLATTQHFATLSREQRTIDTRFSQGCQSVEVSAVRSDVGISRLLIPGSSVTLQKKWDCFTQRSLYRGRLRGKGIFDLGKRLSNAFWFGEIAMDTDGRRGMLISVTALLLEMTVEGDEVVAEVFCSGEEAERLSEQRVCS